MRFRVATERKRRSVAIAADLSHNQPKGGLSLFRWWGGERRGGWRSGPGTGKPRTTRCAPDLVLRLALVRAGGRRAARPRSRPRRSRRPSGRRSRRPTPTRRRSGRRRAVPRSARAPDGVRAALGDARGDLRAVAADEAAATRSVAKLMPRRGRRRSVSLNGTHVALAGAEVRVVEVERPSGPSVCGDDAWPCRRARSRLHLEDPPLRAVLGLDLHRQARCRCATISRSVLVERPRRHRAASATSPR